jgi:Kef-type K+ transport system membrane component KefB
MKEQEVIKSRIKALKVFLYLVMLVWIIMLVYTIYDFISNEINPMLVLALVLIVTSMTIISRLKSVQVKKLEELNNTED